MAQNITPENFSAELDKNTSIYDFNYNISEAADKVGDAVVGQAFGGPELFGLFYLIGSGMVLWYADARIDVTAAVMIPTITFLSEYGYMPFAGGIVDGLLLGISAVFAVGVARYLFR